VTTKREFCEVCHKEVEEVVVCSMPFVPMTVGYCRKCFNANAHPISILVANTSLCGGLENTNEEWKRMVNCTLKHLGVSKEEFERLVAEDTEKFN